MRFNKETDDIPTWFVDSIPIVVTSGAFLAGVAMLIFDYGVLVGVACVFAPVVLQTICLLIYEMVKVFK